MKTVKTNLFGEITVAEEKIITFADGIIGFPQLQQFTLVVDEEKTSEKIFWLQSLDEEGFALPIVDPFAIFEEYNPIVEDEWFGSLGEHTEDDLLVFLTMSVPSDITKITVNKKAPLIINTKTQKACQIIVDSEEYQVQCPVYEILRAANEKAGD